MKRGRKDLIVTVHSDDDEEEGQEGSDDLELEGLEEALDFDGGGIGQQTQQQQALAVDAVPAVTGEEEGEQDGAAAPRFSLREGERKPIVALCGHSHASDRKRLRV